MSVAQRKADLQHWVQTHYPESAGEFKTIGGDAGFRHYYRFFIHDEPYLAVDAPPATENSAQFLAVASWLEQVAVRSPQVYQADVKQGFLVIEDCGDTLLFDQLKLSGIGEHYRQALSMVHQLQRQQRPESLLLESFDAGFMQRELAIFHDWLVTVHLGLSSEQLESCGWSAFCDWIAVQVAAQPYAPMHRDFHSRNLLVHQDSLVTIDFQDMVWGPVTYDLVSLLKDCYLVWPDSLTKPIVEDFFRESELLHRLPVAQAWEYYQLTGLQRHLKAAGIFARLHHRDNKSGYLAAIPDTLRYILDVLGGYPEWRSLYQFIDSKVLQGVQYAG